MRSPVQWLFNAALLLLGAAIALQLAVAMLSDLLPWLAGIGLVAGGALVAWRVREAKRRRW